MDFDMAPKWAITHYISEHNAIRLLYIRNHIIPFQGYLDSYTTYSVDSCYYDTNGVKRNYQYIQIISISNINLDYLVIAKRW